MNDAGQAVQRVFLQALSVDESERGGFLAHACGGDDGLRAEVERLLEHDSQATADGFLSQRPQIPALEIGQRVDSYTILGLLGEGGMGEVYLIEEDAPLSRRLALKVLRLGLDSRRILSRFEVERRTLARMDHPGIARVVDAGATPRGQPYFVMEYVPGIPITEICSQRELPLRDRLALFVEVCRAIQHAHQAGVIHRDLKPTNLLVADCDGDLVAKVIDFGLARATDRRLESDATITEAGQLIGTPEYMSPEQVDGADYEVDIRSDVYALGAILYELLTGERLFEGLRADGEARMRHRIREESVIPPSRRAGRAALAGDLDCITMTALAKQPDRRYRTVAEFADDVLRHLADEPIRARPPGTLYLLQKFVRRHRGAVAATSLAVAAILVGLAGTTNGMLQAEAARAEAQGHLADFELLGLGVSLQRALVEERQLYPPWPHVVPRMRQWLAEHAAPLVAQRDTLWRTLDEIRARALPYAAGDRDRDAQRFAVERAELRQLRERLRSLDVDGAAHARVASRVTELEQLVTQRACYTFEDERDHVLHDGLAALTGEIQTFCAKGDGCVARVEANIEWAERIERATIADVWPAWHRAIESVAADSRFVGFELSPQLGLVPKGCNPDSGLQQFAHLRSGVMFVLVPGSPADPRAPERPTLDPFFCATREVTFEQWRRLGGEDLAPPPVVDSAPAVAMNWHEGDELLRRHGLSLPSEAQWLHVAGTREPAFGIEGLFAAPREWCNDAFDRDTTPPRPGDGRRASAQQAFRVTRDGDGRFPARADAQTTAIGLRPVRPVLPPATNRLAVPAAARPPR